MNKATLSVLFALAATAAACSDNTVAPRSDAVVSTPSVYGGGATEALTQYDTTRFTITIETWHTTYFSLGAGNTITFPAHSVCDPNQSTYGVTEWNKSCATAYGVVTVNVSEWLDAKGHARIDFDKHLRFVPSSNSSNWVVLSFTDVTASVDPFFNILYCATTTSTCVDESLTDPSLLTIRNPTNGMVTRRVKHFSGYNVAAGNDASSYNRRVSGGSLSVSTADLTLNDLQAVGRAHPDLTTQDVSTMLEKIREARGFAGYILASGLTGGEQN